MTSSAPAPPTTRPAPRVVVTALLVLVVALVVLGSRLLAPSSTRVASSSSSSSSSSAASSSTAGAVPWSSAAAPPLQTRRPEHGGPLGEADGAVPDGTTAFDDEVPGIANLDPALRSALRDATTDAADDGVEIHVNSGWRSPEYQEHLLREAIAEHGSEEEAARWVATAETSLHVAGDAVDIGPSEAASWLAEQGAGHGLCRIYANEPWHFELRPEAIDGGCPRPYADPTEDPRMQR